MIMKTLKLSGNAANIFKNATSLPQQIAISSQAE
jgi:hypothetical protein